MSNISTITYNGSIIAQTEEDDNVIVTYNGKTIANIGVGETKTLLCANKGMNTNLIIGSKTLLCKLKEMATNVTINVATPTAYAVFSETDGSLTFYKTSDTITEGQPYRGKVATAIYTGIETDDYHYSNRPWSDKASSIISVTVADEGIAPISTLYWFYNFSNCTSMDLAKLDTSNVPNMQNMFANCSNLQSLDLSSFNTVNVTDMSHMFKSCSSLESITFGSNWNTQNVTNMSSMFNMCSVLESLDLSGWNTTNVEDMKMMFANCEELTTVGGISGWNTQNVTNMYGMFQACSRLTSLDFSGWNTANVENMSQMFFLCSKLEFITLGDGWDTQNVTDMYAMFQRCTSLTSLDVSRWDTSSVTNMGQLFLDCYSLTSLDLSGWDTSNVTDIHSFANMCNSLTTIILGLNFGQEGHPTSGIFYVPNYVETTITGANDFMAEYDWVADNRALPLTAYAVYSANDKSLTFYKTTDTITQGGTYNNKAATKVYTGIETATYTKAAEVPWGSYTSSIRKVTVVDEIKPVSTAFWFLNMEVCDSMNLSKLDTSNVSNMCRMFSGCEELTSVGDISGWDTSNVIDMSYMFYECGSLILDCSGWNVDKVTNHTNFKISASDVIAPTWVN